MTLSCSPALLTTNGQKKYDTTNVIPYFLSIVTIDFFYTTSVTSNKTVTGAERLPSGVTNSILT